MSAEAIAHVYRFGPQDRTLHALLLAIADSVNDQYDHELWTSQSTLAKKSRLSRATVWRALGELIALGWIEEVDADASARGQDHGTGTIVRYRFLFDDERQVVFETRGRKAKKPAEPVAERDTPPAPAPVAERDRGVAERDTPLFHAATGVSHGDVEIRTQAEPKSEPKQNRASLAPLDAEVLTGELVAFPGAVMPPVVRTERTILKAWWDEQDPRPAQPFMAALKVLESAHGKGWSLDDIERYLDDEGCPVSGASLDLWRKRQRQQTRPQPQVILNRSSQALANVLGRRAGGDR